MKKVAVATLLCGLVFLTSACGSKKLVCTAKGTDIGKKTSTEIAVYFDGKKASSIKEKIEITFEEAYKDSIDTYYKVLNESYNQDTLGEGIKVKITKGDNNLNVNLDIDVQKQAESQNAASAVDTSGSREDIKKELQNRGYTCK